MGSGSAVRAGIHAGLGRSGKGERVRIDKTGQEGVLRENPQPCCPLLPHLALAATSRSRSREVHGRPSRITGSPRRAPCPSSWSNDFCAEVPDRRENSRPRGGAFPETSHGFTRRDLLAGNPRDRHDHCSSHLQCTLLTWPPPGVRS